MKIGILTFHWATNYGAVLQAFALSHYLEMNGYDVEIIRYEPAKYMTSFRNIFYVRSLSGFKDYIYKMRIEKRIRSFRQSYLHLSNSVSSSQNELSKNTHIYDCVIVGSDQIWNQSFTRAEGPVYYLDFLGNKVKKIAYAASFGTVNLEDSVRALIQKHICDFNALSVREYSGKDIVRSFGLDVQVVCDPVFLLPSSNYKRFISKSCKKTVFVYMLKNDKEKWRKALNSFFDNYEIVTNGEENCFTVEEWLSLIHNSDLVVTDSFHCTAFCLLFNTSFYSVNILGSGMNDRLNTLLSEFGLLDLFIDYDRLDLVKNVPLIEWRRINEKLSVFSEESKLFLQKALER